MKDSILTKRTIAIVCATVICLLVGVFLSSNLYEIMENTVTVESMICVAVSCLGAGYVIGGCEGKRQMKAVKAVLCIFSAALLIMIGAWSNHKVTTQAQAVAISCE